jgi:hypothetical protein
MTRAAVLCATMVTMAGLAAPAGAATLTIEDEFVYLGAGGYIAHNAVYVAGPEANNVTVVGRRPSVVAVHDPGVALDSGGCFSPQGKGTGVCWLYPGEVCDGFSGSCSYDIGRFRHFIGQLGDGADRLTLVQGAPAAVVSMGSGNDSLNARNKVADQIDCGDGIDKVVADPYDTVSSNCEAVTRG